MESIGYLNGVWCAQSDSISDAESTITRNDLGTRMLSQPTRQGCRFIVGQHVNGPADSQVDQEQAIPQWPSVQREIIHPNSAGGSLIVNSWSRNRRRRVSPTRVSADPPLPRPALSCRRHVDRRCRSD